MTQPLRIYLLPTSFLRLASIEVPPLHSVSTLKQVPVDGCGRGLDAAVEAEAHASAVDKLLKTVAAV